MLGFVLVPPEAGVVYARRRGSLDGPATADTRVVAVLIVIVAEVNDHLVPSHHQLELISGIKMMMHGEPSKLKLCSWALHLSSAANQQLTTFVISHRITYIPWTIAAPPSSSHDD